MVGSLSARREEYSFGKMLSIGTTRPRDRDPERGPGLFRDQHLLVP